ncbi:MAG: hypothetical protein J1E06_03110 [Acutalibacter sp.]|nr:hypothetical protein [Acutalibacter sp.]
MRILEDLWYGKVIPWQMGIKSEEYKGLMAQIAENEDKLMELLSEEAKVIYEQLMAQQSEAVALEQREAFIRNFKLGARFMMEVADETDFSSVSV